MNDRSLTPRQQAWQDHKAARRKRRGAERLLGRITGLPKSQRRTLTGWIVMHPPAEVAAQRRPVRKRAPSAPPPIPVDASTRIPLRDRVLRGRLSNPTALR